MSSLLVLLDDDRQESTITELSELVDDTVSSQSGLTGLTLKGSLAALKKVDSDAVNKGLTTAFPEIVKAMESYWKTYQTSVDCCFGMHLENDRAGVAGKLMAIVDKQVERIENPAVERIYHAARGKAVRVVESRVGDLGTVLEENLSK